MRIFVAPSQLAAGALVIRGDEHHYLMRVRRARTGDAVELVDGDGRRARATIARIADAETELAVAEPEAIPAATPRVCALIPLIKGDRMDQCLEKLVEVGCDEILVWPAARAVVRLDADRRASRLAKWKAALHAAARQCGRPHITAIAFADSLAAAIANRGGLCIVLDPASDGVLDATGATDVTLVSGPEGGFAPEELEALAAFTSVGLGPRVLRAETAPVIATAIVRAQTRS